MEESAAVTPTGRSGPVQPSHRFDSGALEDWMAAHVDGFTPPVELGQYHGGMSNPTFLVTDRRGRRYVLRKKPPGELLPSAHAVDREYRVISALAGTGVPVPKALALCEDASVIGQVFYVMAFVDGRVFRGVELRGCASSERARIYGAMAEVLASLHDVDYRAAGLGDFGREGGYCTRQVRRWSQQYRASQTDDLPEMDRLMAWLADNIPDDSLTTLVHGDYRLENLIFDVLEPKVLAVVDWELATLGNPWADFAYNCLPWHGADPGGGDLLDNDPASTGIPSEAAHVERYCRLRGIGEIPDWNFYLVLSLFRLAAIVQGVYYRGLQGNTPTANALRFKELCRDRAHAAWRLVERAGT